MCFLKIRRKGGQDTASGISQKTRKKSCKDLKQELKGYQKQGISLYLDGRPSSPKNIAKACQIAEGGGYMRDYTEDESGRIARVDFDLIKEKEPG